MMTDRPVAMTRYTPMGTIRNALASCGRCGDAKISHNELRDMECAVVGCNCPKFVRKLP